jgi:hypothetical protein
MLDILLAALLGLTEPNACSAEPGIERINYCGSYPVTPPNNGGGTCTYYVSPGGKDTNAGTTFGAPFATLAKLQAALQASGSGKVGCLEAGTWNVSSPLTFTTADNGETWQNATGTAIGAPILDGGTTVQEVIELTSGSGITFNGFTVQNFYAYGIHHDASNNLANITITNMSIGGTTITGNWSSGAITINGVNGLTVTNNYIHDTSSEGISFFAYDTGNVLDNVLIANNVCLRAVQAQTDGGCIYVSDHNGYKSSGNTIIKNNYIKDVGASGSNQATGIYLDDSASYWTITGNVIGPPNPAGSPASSGYSAMGIEVNNGSYNIITNNIIDIGPSTNVAAVLFYYGDNPITSLTGPHQTGEVVQNNVIITNHAGNQNNVQWGNYQYPQFSGGAGDYTINTNLYWNFGSGNILTDGTVASDTSPHIENPDFSSTTDYNYTLAGGSPVFSSPFNFTAIQGGWGPSGFTIPINGQAPSY